MDSLLFDADYNLGLDFDFESSDYYQIPSLPDMAMYNLQTPSSSTLTFPGKSVAGMNPSEQLNEGKHDILSSSTPNCLVKNRSDQVTKSHNFISDGYDEENEVHTPTSSTLVNSMAEMNHTEGPYLIGDGYGGENHAHTPSSSTLNYSVKSGVRINPSNDQLAEGQHPTGDGYDVENDDLLNIDLDDMETFAGLFNMDEPSSTYNPNMAEVDKSAIFNNTVVDEPLMETITHFVSDSQIISNGVPFEHQQCPCRPFQVRHGTGQQSPAIINPVANIMIDQTSVDMDSSFTLLNQSGSAVLEQQFPCLPVDQTGLGASTIHFPMASIMVDQMINQPISDRANNVAAVMHHRSYPSSPVQVKRHRWAHKNKKSKGSSIGFEDLSKYFYMTIKDASEKMNLGLTFLKSICRKVGITRWPQRKLRSLNNLILQIQDEICRCGDKRLMVELATLLEYKRAMERNPEINLTPETRRLRQAFFKANFKRRKYQAMLSKEDLK